MKIFNIAELGSRNEIELWMAFASISTVWACDCFKEFNICIEMNGQDADRTFELHFDTKEQRDEAMKAFLDRWREA